MPFSEFDEEPGRLPRLHWRWAQRWPREIFLKDLSLKLLALAITLGLWYGVTSQRMPTTMRYNGVHLNLHLPNEMEVSNELHTEVEVTLTGAKTALERLNARDLVATVDMTDYKPGMRSVKLNSNTVRMNLPEGVRIDDIEPNTLALRLEPRIERQLEVEVKLEGKLPDGYELRRANVAPDKIRVRGPASHVNALRVAPTEPIMLDGHTENFSQQQTAIEIPDQRVDVMDAVVNVYLEIGERRVEKTLTGISVRESGGGPARPSSASATLYGDRSALEQLRSKDIELYLDAAPDGTKRPRLVLPPGMEGRIELRSTNLPK